MSQSSSNPDPKSWLKDRLISLFVVDSQHKSDAETDADLHSKFENTFAREGAKVTMDGKDFSLDDYKNEIKGLRVQRADVAFREPDEAGKLQKGEEGEDTLEVHNNDDGKVCRWLVIQQTKRKLTCLYF